MPTAAKKAITTAKAMNGTIKNCMASSWYPPRSGLAALRGSGLPLDHQPVSLHLDHPHRGSLRHGIPVARAREQGARAAPGGDRDLPGPARRDGDHHAPRFPDQRGDLEAAGRLLAEDGEG